MAVFNGIYFRGDAFPSDFANTYYPLTAYWIASVQAGEWPSWIPYVAMGYPFASEAQSGAFYPVLWLFPLLHIPYTLQAAAVVQALHVLFGALGACVLAHQLFKKTSVAVVAGAAYMLYGGFYSNAPHPDIVRAFAFTPWIFWAFLREPGSRLPLRALTIPLLIYLLLTGGYAGTAIALFFVLIFFTTTQAVRNYLNGQPLKDAALDLAAQAGLSAIGGLLASAFALPLLVFSGDLNRSAVYLAPGRLFIQPRDVYELLLPSPYLRPKNHLVYSMQLPSVLFPFVAFVSKATLRTQLSPFLSVGVVAFLMSFEPLSFIPDALTRLVPYLGYSRYPSGDYRTLIALPILLVLCGGLNDLLSKEAPTRRYVAFLTTLSLLVIPAVVLVDPPENRLRAAEIFGLVLLPAWMFALIWSRLPRAYVPASVALVGVVCTIPVLVEQQSMWRLESPDQAMREATGVSPEVSQVFAQHLVARPARVAADPDPTRRSWSGYLTGTFQMGDMGSAALHQQVNVAEVGRLNDLVSYLLGLNPLLRDRAYQEALVRDRGFVYYEGEPHGADGLPVCLPVGDDPGLRVDLASFMLQPSALVALRSPLVSCGPSDHPMVPLTGGDVLPSSLFDWRAVQYGRSSITYDVRLSEPAVVVENELFAQGWRGFLSSGGDPLLPFEVDGSLRGWNLPAGSYQFTVSFGTPRLPVGLLLSAVALLVYVLVVVAAARRLGSAAPTRAHSESHPRAVARAPRAAARPRAGAAHQGGQRS